MNGYLNPGKYTAREADYVTAAVAGELSAANDVAVIDIKDLTNVALILDQIVDGGTATFHFDASADGTNWIPDVFTSKADTNFAAGANMSLNIGSLSDSNGMPIRYMQLRVRVTAATAGGVYHARATGSQIGGYAG